MVEAVAAERDQRRRQLCKISPNTAETRVQSLFAHIEGLWAGDGTAACSDAKGMLAILLWLRLIDTHSSLKATCSASEKCILPKLFTHESLMGGQGMSPSGMGV